MKTKDLDQFNGLDIKIEYEKIVKEYAGRAREYLMSAEVSPRSNRPNRSTPYWAGWIVNEKHGKEFLLETVWNRTNWQLTHLLENGHWISNSAHPQITWVEPREHIKSTYEYIKPQYINAMKDVKIDANFK